MRKIISLMHVSLDGFVAGPNGEMDWITMNHEIFADAVGLAQDADTALWGRVCYQMMESYWPTVLTNPSATELEIQHARWTEKVEKIVFSRTLAETTWAHSRIIKEDIVRETIKLKQGPGKDMIIIGSPSITHQFTKHGLIDEYRLNVNPIILGRGIPVFQDTGERIRLELKDQKNYEPGVVGLHYSKI